MVPFFESFLKDELFQASAEELRRLVAGLLQLEKHGGIRVLIRRDLYGRNVSVVVALPRDRFNADLRKALQGLFLERFNGTTTDYHLPPVVPESGASLHDPRRTGQADPGRTRTSSARSTSRAHLEDYLLDALHSASAGAARPP